jgi:hypothetical protein
MLLLFVLLLRHAAADAGAGAGWLFARRALK